VIDFVLQTTVEWAAIGLLLTLLLAIGTAMGTIVKIAYDASQRLGVTMYGDREGGTEGFIQETQQRHDELASHHEQVYEQLLIQGRLLSELSYSFANIAEMLEEEDDLDVTVNLDRIEKLRSQEQNDRWKAEQSRDDEA